MGTWIQVGDEFTLFKEGSETMPDGSYFEALDENDGFTMVTYLTDMSGEEKALLGEGKITTRIIREGNKILTILRFGHSPLLFEVNFDPTLYKDQRAMQLCFENHMVTFISIEKRNNVIQTIRMANMPMKLKQAYITAWTSAYNEPNFSNNYTEWIDSLMSFSTVELWHKGEDIGYFGEKGMLE